MSDSASELYLDIVNLFLRIMKSVLPTYQTALQQSLRLSPVPSPDSDWNTFIGQLQKCGNTETQIVFSTPVPPRGIDVRAADEDEDEDGADDFL